MENIMFDYVSSNPQYAIEARSCVGGRENQQDRAYVYCDEQNVFAIVCDGMGGAADGGIASETAISSMRQAYKDLFANSTENPVSFLYRAMLIADRGVARKLQYKAGGTTMVVGLIRDSLLYWLSVGDSRLYILRSGEFLQVTRDHNYSLRLNELKARGKISDELYRKELSRGDALISYIGLGDVSLFDLTQTGFPLCHNDKILLATDGVFKIFSPSCIESIIGSDNALSVRADSFIHEISAQSEKQIQDNATFILIDVL